jgi:hypothetical protein
MTTLLTASENSVSARTHALRCSWARLLKLCDFIARRSAVGPDREDNEAHAALKKRPARPSSEHGMNEPADERQVSGQGEVGA